MLNLVSKLLQGSTHQMFLLLRSLGLYRPACFLILEANINTFEIWEPTAPHGNEVLP